jgi:phage-related protein
VLPARRRSAFGNHSKQTAGQWHGKLEDLRDSTGKPALCLRPPWRRSSGIARSSTTNAQEPGRSCRAPLAWCQRAGAVIRSINVRRAWAASRAGNLSQNWYNHRVRRLLASDEKPLHWVGSSKRDFLGFPDPVKDDMGNALGIAQFGGTAPTAKPWKGLGSGVLEIVESHDGNAYRAIYTVRFAKAVYVLHAFQKKSPSGIRTATRDVELVGERLKTAEKDYEEHYGTSKR